MTIKKRLIRVLAVALFTFLWFMVTSFYLTATVNTAMEKSRLSKTVISGVFELNLLIGDLQYLSAERAADQWQLLIGRLLQTIDAADTVLLSDEAHTVMESIRTRLLSMDLYFGRIRNGRHFEILQSLRAQLISDSHEAVVLAGRLDRLSDERLNWVMHMLMVTLAVFLINMLAWIFWSYRTLVTRVFGPIQTLQDGVEKVTAGELSTETGLRTQDEIGYFSQAFDRMTANLDRSQQELLRANRELDEKAKQVRSMAAALAVAEQQERRRLAQMLHDHLQQLLVAAKINVNQLLHATKPEDMQSGAKGLSQLLDESLAATRTLTAELSPPVLQDAGLGAAIDWLARWMKELHGLDVKVEHRDESMIPSEDAKIFLFQAVRELLFNVVKHAGTTEAFVTLDAGPDVCRVKVWDNGVGFDFSRQRFEADWASGMQAMTHTGLANMRNRLLLLGGAFDAHSAPGKGARFLISVPAIRLPGSPAVGRPGKRSRRKRHSGPIRVMTVDDHKLFRQGLISMLRDYKGIEVVGEAGDGKSALQKVAVLKPDVVVMDVSMPEMNGVEATRFIRERFPDVEVIGLSLHDSGDMEDLFKKAGAAAYHNKSEPIDYLVKSIQHVMGMEEEPSPVERS